jgi:hypothetical protein
MNDCVIKGANGNDIFVYSAYSGCSLYGESGSGDKVDYGNSPSSVMIFNFSY